MKRFFAILLVIVMLISIMVIPAQAAGALNISISDAECAAGGMADISVSIMANPGIAYLSIRITCDAKITVKSQTNGVVFSSMTSGVNCVWVTSDNISACGTLLTFTVEASGDTTPGDYEIGLRVIECYDIDENDVATSISKGKLTVKCPHNDITNVATVPATCKTEGYTAGVYCNRCNTYISGHETIVKTNDHNFGNWTKISDIQHKHTCSVCKKEETASHSWNSSVVTTQPTHLSEGVKTYTCNDCGATKTESIGKLTTHSYGDWEKYSSTQHKHTCACGSVEYENHSWNSGTVTTQPTCKDTGVKTYTCTVCGERKTETVAKTGNHTFDSWTKISDTQHKHTCSVCKKEETASHSWNSGVVTIQPTHLAEGVRTYTCADCGATKTETVAKTTAHSYGSWEKHDATQHKHVCACGSTEYENHSWNNGIVTTQPTHLVEGIKTFTCVVCGATKTEPVGKTTAHSYGNWEKHDGAQHKHICACGSVEYENHSWNSGVVTTQPTHLVEGIKTFTCVVCGATKTEPVGKTTAHSYGNWEKYDATQHKHICACGSTEYENHSWDNGKVTTQPTCRDAGIKTYTCTVCGETKTESVAKLTTHSYGAWQKDDASNHKHTCSVCGKIETASHSWNNGVVTTQPTCQITGVKTYTCTVCGETKTETVAKTDNHSFGAWTKDTESKHKHTCSICEKVETADHTWNVGAVTKEATEDETGIRTYTCITCGQTKIETIPKADHVHKYGTEWKKDATSHWHECNCGDKSCIANHTWTEKVTTPATHFAEGSKTLTCTVCGYSKTETIAKLTAHEYGAWEKYSETQHKHSCACGDIQYEDHTWDSGKGTTQPTHLEEGTKTYTCTKCGATKTETVAKLTTHDYGEWTKHTADRHKRTCECGNVQYENHIWDNGTVKTAATHLAEGIMTYTCTACGETKTESIPKLAEHAYGEWTKHTADQHKHTCECGNVEYADHTWDSGVVTKEATQNEEGIRTYTCTVCGETRTATIPTLAHTHDYKDEWKKDDANHWKECGCGERSEVSGHTWDAGETAKAATCSEAGEILYTCTICGATRTEAVSATGHTFSDWKMNGDHLERTCSCGETETQAVEKVIEEVKDEKTGMSVSTEGNAKLPEGTKLVAVDITKTISETESEEVKTAIKVIGEDNELLSIFDISLEFDNSKIQPDGMVKVELPMPKVEEGKEYKSYKVVYIDDDGVAHDMPTEVKDGKIIFTTDHFSRYAIVGVDAPIDNTSSGIPTWAIVLIACAGVIAVAGTAVFLVVKKKKTAK